MRTVGLTLFTVLYILALGACQSDEELRKIKHDIAQIQEQIYQVENSQAELQRQLGKVSDTLSQKIEDRRDEANQQEKIYSMQDTVSQLNAKVEDLESKFNKQKNMGRNFNVQNTGSESSSETDMPNSVSGTDLEIQYNTCFGDFNRGEYQLSALGFEDLISNYPTSPFANESYYYLGRSYFELNNWQKAAVNFGKLLKTSEKSSFAKQAMLYLGQCYHYLNMPRKAVMKLKELQNLYPDSQEAALAKSFLRKNQYEQ